VDWGDGRGAKGRGGLLGQLVVEHTADPFGHAGPPFGRIQVTFKGSDFYGTQTTVGTDYFTPASAYTSATVPSAPPGPGLAEINGGSTTPDTIAFSAPVTDPLVAVVSLGTGYLAMTVTLSFNAPCTVLSYGPDPYVPTGTGALTASDGGVSGIEGSGVVQLKGTFQGM
jgi:hypothetical protein